MVDTPLEPFGEATEREAHIRDSNIVDLAGIRLELGRTPYKVKRCEHVALLYSPSERRVWCRDCEQTVDGFDAFMVLNRHLSGMLNEAASKQRKADEALASTLVRRAAKDIDRTWGGKMAPLCPHCREGLLPEDFDRVRACVSAEILRARRERDRLEASQPTPSRQESKGGERG